MKTQNSKLVFKKNAISELSTKQLNQIKGGSITQFFQIWLQNQIDEAMEEMSKWI